MHTDCPCVLYSIHLIYRLSADAKRDEAVIHALSVRTAVTSGNYVMFFRLYKTAPNLGTFLMGELFKCILNAVVAQCTLLFKICSPEL